MVQVCKIGHRGPISGLWVSRSLYYEPLGFCDTLWGGGVF